MDIKVKIGFPDTMDALVKTHSDALHSAIQRAVVKALAREVRASVRIAFEGEDFNGDPIEEDNNN